MAHQVEQDTMVKQTFRAGAFDLNSKAQFGTRQV
jgi:hypothetical protein